MRESDINPTDCVQTYPEINGFKRLLLKTVHPSEAPTDWPQTWTHSVTYQHHQSSTELGINIQTEQDVYGIVGWKGYVTETGEIKTGQTITSSSLPEVIEFIQDCAE